MALVLSVCNIMTVSAEKKDLLWASASETDKPTFGPVILLSVCFFCLTVYVSVHVVCMCVCVLLLYKLLRLF